MYSGLELAGRYRLDRLLGRGGMGEVWRATDDRLDRSVAVKLVPYHVGMDPSLMARLRREAQITAGLQHPGITVVYDTGEHRQMLYVVMELLKGETLSIVLNKHPRGLHIADILYFTEQIAEALAAAHAQGIVHRAIKPANLMVLNERGRVKICDFGIARFAEVTVGLTGSGLAGSPTFMAPEQFDGGQVNGQTDLYALGCVLFQMQTGSPPFRADLDTKVLARSHLTVAPPSPRTTHPQLPPELDELTLALLAKKPTDRPASAAGVADLVRAIRARIASGAPPPPSATPPASPQAPLRTPPQGVHPQAPPAQAPPAQGRHPRNHYRPDLRPSDPRPHIPESPERGTPAGTPDAGRRIDLPTSAFPGPPPRTPQVRTPGPPDPPRGRVGPYGGSPDDSPAGPAGNPSPGSPGRSPDGPSSASPGASPPEDPVLGVAEAPDANGHASPPPPGRGEDIETDIAIDFAESISGVVIPLRISDDRKCRECSGYGLAGSEVCSACRGRGQITHVRTIRVRIPPGTRDRQRIRLVEKGADGVGGQPPGDLYLLVHVEPHTVFGRRDDHLTVTVPMSYEEATQGGEIKVPVLGGPPVTVRVPPATPNGRIFRIRHRGVGRADGTRGDLLVTVEVHVPQGTGGNAADLREELIQSANAL